MLSNPSRNNNILLPVLLAPLIQRLDDLLRFHQLSSFRLRRHESERIVGLPFGDFVEPFCSGIGRRGEEWEQGGEGGEDVSGDGDVGVDDLVDVLRLNFEVDDSSSTFRCGELGSRSERCRYRISTARRRNVRRTDCRFYRSLDRRIAHRER